MSDTWGQTGGWVGADGWSGGSGGGEFTTTELAVADLGTPIDPNGLLDQITQESPGIGIQYTGDGAIRDGYTEGVRVPVTGGGFWTPAGFTGANGERASFLIEEVAAFNDGADLPFAGLGLIDPSQADSGVMGALGMVSATARGVYTASATSGAAGGSFATDGRKAQVEAYPVATNRGLCGAQLLTAGNAITSSAGPFTERSATAAGSWVTGVLTSFLGLGLDSASANTYSGTYRFWSVSPHPTLRAPTWPT